MIRRVAPQINQDLFYLQRDARSGIDYPVLQLPSQRIAVVVPASVTRPEIGIELALFWTVSIIRRMGRPFAELIIVTSDELRHSEALTGGGAANTVEQLILTEAASADPFAPVHWRNWATGVDMSDADKVIWLGSLPLGVQTPQVVGVNASGWISIVQEPSSGDLSLNASDFDAAPAAVVFSVCMAAARVFSAAFGELGQSRQVAFALDSGATATDPTVCANWLKEGKTLDSAPPWKGDATAAPQLRKLLVVSAGGIGGNLCQILSDSYIQINSACVVEPDKFELSNLNRAVGVDWKLAIDPFSKALFAIQALRPRVQSVTAVEKTYESWITEEIAQEFREPDTAVVIGVDQIKTRLAVGSDWPSILLNGSTSGLTFSTSVHSPDCGGCIGCWYGQSEATYATTRAPMACAAGMAPSAPQRAVPLASYPFVSIATAAHLAALLIGTISKTLGYKHYAGTVFSMSLRTPENTHVRKLPIDERCLLLCSESYLQDILGRSTERISQC